MGQLLQLSIYWRGINLIWGALNVINQPRMDELVGPAQAGSGLALITILGTVVAILVQPVVGSISDYTQTRWGRRKPYIFIGATLDVLFLIGLATSNTYLGLVVFMTLLSFSSNFAQGPFQGYVPDLVPSKQVGQASGFMGLMIMLGRVAGTAIGTIGLFTGSFILATVGVGLLELATAIVTIFTVDEGRRGLDRKGRSWVEIAKSTWGLDVFQQRSFVWLLASRLFLLMAPVVLTDFIYFYLRRSMGFTDQETGMWINVALPVFAVATLLTTFPAASFSDRLGRKPLIYLSCVVGSIGMLGTALAPTVQVTIAFAVLTGIATGAFLAVDWALMTDIIPKESSGRYMGMSNVASATAGPIAVTLSGITMDHIGGLDFGVGPRAAFGLSLIFYAVGALLLTRVHEPGREDELPEAAAPTPSAVTSESGA